MQCRPVRRARSMRRWNQVRQRQRRSARRQRRQQFFLVAVQVVVWLMKRTCVKIYGCDVNAKLFLLVSQSTVSG